MKIHIVGAGPTGMSVAWELINTIPCDVTIYDRKLDAGGSWWEPSFEYRDLHAHRIVFDRAFVNTRSLFDEMNIRWDDVFQPTKYDYGYILKNLSFSDYLALGSLSLKVLTLPWRYSKMTLKDALGDSMSERGKKIVQRLTFQIDGVPWNVMSAYEFVKSFDHAGLSTMYTQRVSGRAMCYAMQKALIKRGVKFVFNKELADVDYLESVYFAKFTDGTEISDGLLVLCIDNTPAIKLVKENWGPDAKKQISDSTYGCINVLLDYPHPIKLEDDLKIAVETPWNLQPVVLSDQRTVSCVICDLTDEILETNPKRLINEVIRQLKVPKPQNVRIGWGSTWNGKRWTFSQSSGVLSVHGQVPFFGHCKNVALCGMMSPRSTPYSSMEAAIEVGRRFCHENFGTRKPMWPLTITRLIAILVLLIYVSQRVRVRTNVRT